jgi:hypothetical protein
LSTATLTSIAQYLGQLNAENAWTSANIFSANSFPYYQLLFRNVAPVTNKDNSFGARFYTNGNKIRTDSNYFWCAYGNDNGGNNPQSGSENYLALWPAARSGPQTGSGIFGSMTLYNPQASESFYPNHNTLLNAPLADNNVGCQGWLMGSYQGVNTTISGIQFNFYSSDGGISSGVVDIYGISN